MKQESVQVERPEEQTEAVGMDNLPNLGINVKELEAILAKMGAEVSHPIKLDPVARIDGQVVAFWVE